MSEAQERLLQQILDVQKEQLAFARQNREELLALQQKAIAGQSKALRMSRFAILILVLAVAALLIVAARGSRNVDAEKERATDFVPQS